MKRNPSPTHDVNPSTAVSRKEPVEPEPSDTASIPSDIVDPSRVIRPAARRPHLPPLPDLRFEQSYLASLEGAESWQRIAWITVRDQVLLPLIQGTLWTLALAGWRHWNRNAQLHGNTLGSRIRRWWYEVNKWELPPARKTVRNRSLAEKVQDFSKATGN
ncbi:hypothetical protein T310_4069 [Rasamsonia emersonii CBS 393.64]|uniref:DUF1770-domain-containing protein n=1 Tax=Rasamsonia emersonii (strain ATCC 16479 / CBS 393.64 / IMI 116815) TaxID=1408163 RepID=A0A0F4YUX8_RASE3|nr:hypothetical protein T310_4069 [Rasamsonia emersonii CBS 393.64]KKA21905.1 hypothetical protein T310_4069 [Rasamsonia emersonii CBS 393.64]